MRFNGHYLRHYLEVAPAALAIERSLECEILAAQPFARPILDVGCGDGVFAAILFGESIDTGIDLDPAEIARARASERYHELIACGGGAIPRADGYYRTIFSNSVLEHIPDLLPVLKEQHRLLAPTGRFYVTVPTNKWEKSSFPARLLNAAGLKSSAERYARFYNSFWRHYHAYPVAQWRALFQDVGFDVLEQREYAPANMTTLLDALTVTAAPSLVSKKLLGRWIAFPVLRRVTAPVIHLAVSRLAAKYKREHQGNLVFFALSKCCA